MKNFITVYEALKICDKGILYSEVYNTYTYLEDPNKPTSLTMSFINECLNLEPVKLKNFCVVYVDSSKEYDEESDVCYDQYGSYVYEFDKDKKYAPVLFDKTLKNKDLSVLPYCQLAMTVKTLSSYESAPSYAYDMCETKEILSYHISLSNIERIGLEKMLSYILFEMTYFGFNIYEIKDEIDSMTSTMNECLKKYQDHNECEPVNIDDLVSEKEEVEIRREKTVEEIKMEIQKKGKRIRMGKECDIISYIISFETYNEIVNDLNAN